MNFTISGGKFHYRFVNQRSEIKRAGGDVSISVPASYLELKQEREIASRKLWIFGNAIYLSY